MAALCSALGQVLRLLSFLTLGKGLLSRDTTVKAARRVDIHQGDVENTIGTTMPEAPNEEITTILDNWVRLGWLIFSVLRCCCCLLRFRNGRIVWTLLRGLLTISLTKYGILDHILHLLLIKVATL